MRFISRVKQAFGILFNTATTLNRSINTYAQYPTYKAVENGIRYTNTDDIYSVVKLLSTTAAMIPMYVYEVVNDDVKKKLQKLSFKEHLFVHKALQQKSLGELPDNDKLKMLIEKPNDMYGKYEFFEALYSFLLIQGECIIWKEIIEFGPDKGKVNKLHFLYPQYTIIKVSDVYPFQILRYSYMVNGVTILADIPSEEIIHIKYFNSTFGIFNGELRGLSPLKVLSRRIERVDSNMDVSVAQLQNGGVPGIVTQKGVEELATETAGQRKQNFYNYMSSSSNKGMPYFSTGDLSYIQLGLKLADMDVATLEKIDFKKICNAYGVSDVLFNNGESSTESNVQEMMKRLYTNSILPDVMRVRDALNAGLLPHYKDKKRFINYDLSGVVELQADMKDTVEWLNKAYWLTGNEKREFTNFEELNIDLMNQVLYPTNIQTEEQLLMGDNIAATGDYGLKPNA